jgi:hypothetical protein
MSQRVLVRKPPPQTLLPAHLLAEHHAQRCQEPAQRSRATVQTRKFAQCVHCSAVH